MTPQEIANLRDQCMRFESRTDVQLNAPAIYRRVKRAKLESVCFAHMPVFRRIWDIESLVREAAKYADKTRSEMLAEAPHLYSALIRRKLHHLLPPSRRGRPQKVKK